MILNLVSGLKIPTADLQLPQSSHGSLPLTVVVSGAMPISRSAQTLYGHFIDP